MITTTSSAPHWASYLMAWCWNVLKSKVTRWGSTYLGLGFIGASSQCRLVFIIEFLYCYDHIIITISRLVCCVTVLRLQLIPWNFDDRICCSCLLSYQSQEFLFKKEEQELLIIYILLPVALVWSICSTVTSDDTYMLEVTLYRVYLTRCAFANPWL